MSDTIDPGLYNAPRYRITHITGRRPEVRVSADGRRHYSPTTWVHALFHELVPGIPREFDRDELVGRRAFHLHGSIHVGDKEAFERRALGDAFIDERLKVEAETDGTWVPASLWWSRENPVVLQAHKPQAKSGGRPRLVSLSDDQRRAAKEAKRLHAKGVTWPSVEHRLKYSRKTLLRWIELLN